ncbi:DUF58 domain-containing protein [Ureibacillus thermophilus]|uniref:DUF58 domain-containing protein n=1 Tax=Ureibacillus thermophilus TaxID=367743 RepID=A0A4P6UMY9_9BACL|nr:DUF58 domain-containing protein [Ureibacillus thermophilus]QBK24539.1 DUF58 domain-containing protein [Ureibacillus thermophilus]
MNMWKGMLNKFGRVIVNLILIAATFSYAMFQGGFVSWFLFYSLIPFLLYSILLNFVPLHIEEVSREVQPAKLARGDKASVMIRFKNKTWFPLAFLTVGEIGLNDHIVGKSTNIFFVGFKRNFSWSYEIPELERGIIEFSALQFTVTDFFGWTVRHKFIPLKQTVIVYPKITKIKYGKVERQFDQGGMLSPFHFVKDTSLVTSVRDYQAGDRFSWIHWKSFAKDETLRTKDFEVRHSQEVLLVLDATVNRHFEDAVDLAASVLQTIVENNGDVSFYIAGKERAFYPQIKRGQFEKVMQQLSIVQAYDSNNIELLLTKEGKTLDSSILLFTGELSDSLRNFFKNHGKKSKGIVCFVLSSEQEMKERIKENYYNVKIVPITKAMFPDVFTEVLRP